MLVKFTTLLLMSSLVACASSGEPRCPDISELGEEIRLQRTPDPDTEHGYLIPRDLDAAVAELDAMLPLPVRTAFACEPDMIRFHHGFGTWIRNNWGLWAGGPLAAHFNELGVRHPDDMSAIILTSYQRHLRSEPRRLEEQLRKYREYWESKPEEAKP